MSSLGLQHYVVCVDGQFDYATVLYNYDYHNIYFKRKTMRNPQLLLFVVVFVMKYLRYNVNNTGK